MQRFIKKNNNWSEPDIIFENTKSFSININKFSQSLDLFCQDNFNNIYLQSYKNNKWHSKIILNNKDNNLTIKSNIKINTLISQNNYALIYNKLLDKHTQNYYLVMSKINNSDYKQWQPFILLDKLYTDNFSVQKISSDHAIIYYVTKDINNKINLGYKEINLDRQSEFYIIHSTYYKIIDTSFLTTNSSIHSLYTVKNMFTKQVIYKNKQSNNFSRPIVLFENPNINNNLLLIIKNNLYALWTINNKLYVSISDNNGLSFNKPYIYNQDFYNIKKATYLSDLNMQEKKFFCRELYINKNNPYEIRFLFELQQEMLKNLGFDNLDSGNLDLNNQNQDFELNNSLNNKLDLNLDLELIKKLKNQLDLKDKSLNQKNQQILDLTNLIKTKNEEIISLYNKQKNNKQKNNKQD